MVLRSALVLVLLALCIATASAMQRDAQAPSWTPSWGAVNCTNNNDCTPGSFCKKVSCETYIGSCATIITRCPTLPKPVCGCNGKTYTNWCFANKDLTNIAYLGKCQSTVRCRMNSDCPYGDYCKKPDRQCRINTGTCDIRPYYCTQEYAPVCGCDGRTYGNRCTAAANGTSVQYTGQCGQSPVPSTAPSTPPSTAPAPSSSGRCNSDRDCASRFCLRAPGQCWGMGNCFNPPDVCIDLYNPVCGCDGKTYGNDCYALRARVSIKNYGPC